jgi:hypothetical protein
VKRHTSLAAIALILPLLAACGTTTEDRSLGGAALGASFGALLGIGLGPIGVLPGAALGAVAGSTTGAFTDPEQVNYGVPVWRQENVRAGMATVGEAVSDAAEAAADAAEPAPEPASPEARPLIRN